MMREVFVPITVHGRYLLEVPEGDGPFPLLLGFHGYGENAQRLLGAMRSIPGLERWIVCAVEAPHPFYNSKTQEVVASWMTRQGRELAIEDNIAYVRQVVLALRAELPCAEPLVFAGFSQGVAMAYRAAARAQLPCHGVVALAGDVPPELADLDLGAMPPVLIGRGTADEWYDTTKLDADLELLRGKGVAVSHHIFQGGHLWTDEFRQVAGEFLEGVRSRSLVAGSVSAE